MGDDIFVRIYRYTVAHSDAGALGAPAGHSVVFATSREKLDAMDPDTHGFDPLALIELVDAAKVASVLTDLYEGRRSVFEAAEGLRGVQVEEIIEEGL